MRNFAVTIYENNEVIRTEVVKARNAVQAYVNYEVTYGKISSNQEWDTVEL